MDRGDVVNTMSTLAVALTGNPNVGKSTLELVHFDVIIDNLEHIEIAGDNFAADALALRTAGEGADNIISLIIIEFV